MTLRGRPARALTILLILMCAPALSWARGQADIDLSAVDKLIAQKRFTEAHLAISEYSKKYPLYMEEAEKRESKILKIEADYRQTMYDLMAAVRSDPTNIERQQALLKKAKALDPERFQEGKDYDNVLAGQTAQVNHDRYVEIFQRGREKLASAAYPDAIAVFREGFSVYRDDFEEGAGTAFPAALVESVNATVASADAASQRWAAALPAFQSGIKRLVDAIDKGGAPDIEAALDSSLTDLRRSLALRNELAADGRLLVRDAADILKADPSHVDLSYFVPYAYRFILGRPVAATPDDKPEGVMGAMDAAWLDAAATVEGKAKDRTERIMAAALKAAGEGDAAAVAAGAAEAKVLARSLSEFESLFSAVAAEEAGADPSTWRQWTGKDRFLARLAAALDAAHAAEGLAILAEASAAAGKSAAALDAARTQLAASPTSALAARLAAIDGGLSSIGASTSALRGLEGEVSALRSRYAAYASADSPGALPLLPWEGRQKAVEDRIASTVAAGQGAMASLVLTRAEAETADAMDKSAADDAILVEARSDLEGTPSDRSDWPDPFRSPDKAADLLEAALADAQKGRKALAALPGKYADYPDYITGSEALRGWSERTSGQLLGLDSFISETEDLIDKAHEQSRLAASDRAQAEKSLSEARAALARNDFSGTAAALKAARKSQRSSLLSQWAPDWFDSFTAAASRVEADANSQRLSWVSANTRRLINEGTDAYYQSDFPSARSAFSQAQTLWRTVFPEDDPETARWISLVDNATKWQTSREIKETDPKYPEIIGTLNDVAAAYQDAKRLLDAKQAAQATAELTGAKQKVNLVLTIWPGLKDAAVWALKLDLLLDRPKGEAAFKSQYDAARAKVYSDDVNQKRMGQADLLVLQTINPAYPGLSDTLAKAKRDLTPSATKDPEVSDADRAASRQLYQQALAIWKTASRAQFPEALADVNQALSRWPGNPDAQALKDKLTVLGLTSGTAVALTDKEKAKLAEAQQDIQNRLTIDAMVILQDLAAANPAIKNNPQWQQLMQRAKQ